MATKAIKTGKAVSLEPMPSYERKVIHTALMKDQKYKNVLLMEQNLIVI